jgi:ribosomal protein S18 acetylase RimI-like enzyme
VELREYTFRLMGPDDEAQVQALFESDPDYFRLVHGAPAGPAEAKDLFNELPEGKEYHDKFVYSVFDRGEALAAVIDLVRGYPNDETWYLGLIFVAPASRNTGLGTRVLDAICAHIKQQGGRAIRLGVVRGNVGARALYDRAGFHFIHERKRSHANGFIVTIDVLERALE